jgi:hypothetical protein
MERRSIHQAKQSSKLHKRGGLPSHFSVLSVGKSTVVYARKSTYRYACSKKICLFRRRALCTRIFSSCLCKIRQKSKKHFITIIYT